MNKKGRKFIPKNRLSMHQEGKTGAYIPKIIFFSLLLIFTVACKSKRDSNKPLTIGDKVSGKVISIIDGDTYDILIMEKMTIRIRMEGIDAPERGMPFYRVSKNYLSELCFGKNVKVKITGKDGNTRFIGYSYLDNGSELAHEMVKAGLAWHFKKYNSDSTLSRLENEARYLRKGIWTQDNPMPPWINRSLHRQGISTRDSFNISDSQR